MSGNSRLAPSTIRGYHLTLRMFCDYLLDARYGWVSECEQRFGLIPSQICHDSAPRRHDPPLRPHRRAVHPPVRPALVTFNTVPIEMPPALDELLRYYLTRRGTTSIASRDHGWLFPGRPPSRHMIAENIRIKLVAHEIGPGQSRSAAMFALAGEIPAPILAELIGINDRTASIWTTLAARKWSEYVTQREPS